MTGDFFLPASEHPLIPQRPKVSQIGLGGPSFFPARRYYEANREAVIARVSARQRRVRTDA